MCAANHYTPPHLAERIAVAREGLVGERKGVTVLFGDIFASPTLFAENSAENVGVLLNEIFKQ